MGAELKGSELSREEQRLEARERSLLRREEGLLRRVTRVVRLADFMAVLMVAATAFSGFATWKTAQVTARMFAVTDRPFLGVQTVSVEQNGSGTPTVVVDFRNFGQFPAADALVSVHVLVDGKAIKPREGELSVADHGIVSPGVPHFFYAYIPPTDYAKVVSGQSRLMVQVGLEYKGPDLGARYCYLEKIIYDPGSASFRQAGGSDKCGSDVF